MQISQEKDIRRRQLFSENPAWYVRMKKCASLLACKFIEASLIFSPCKWHFGFWSTKGFFFRPIFPISWTLSQLIFNRIVNCNCNRQLVVIFAILLWCVDYYSFSLLMIFGTTQWSGCNVDHLWWNLQLVLHIFRVWNFSRKTKKMDPFFAKNEKFTKNISLL